VSESVLPEGSWDAEIAQVGEVSLWDARLSVTRPGDFLSPLATLTGGCPPESIEPGSLHTCVVVANGLRWTFVGQHVGEVWEAMPGFTVPGLVDPYAIRVRSQGDISAEPA
jgi:hypothetical protein